MVAVGNSMVGSATLEKVVATCAGLADISDLCLVFKKMYFDGRV